VKGKEAILTHTMFQMSMACNPVILMKRKFDNDDDDGNGTSGRMYKLHKNKRFFSTKVLNLWN